MIAENAYMEEVVTAIVKGDKIAFEQLFKTWYVRLCVYGESIVRDRDQAEDLVQGIFCLLWEKREDINIHESLKSYLYRSVYYAALNVLKHDKVKSAFLEFIRKHEHRDENNIEHFFENEDRESLMKEIWGIIDSLPEQCREIFVLSRFSGKKSIEIAKLMGISVRTVETQLYRAMKRLREELSHLKNSRVFFLFFFTDSEV